MSQYVCRDHPGQAISFKGTGCPLCAHDSRGRRVVDRRPTPTGMANRLEQALASFPTIPEGDPDAQDETD